MTRREFITFLGGATAAWSVAARAQQADRIRRIGVLMGYASTDPEGQALLAEFARHLAELGWAEGRNVRIDVRWGGSNVDLLHTFAKELIGLQPDVLLASSTPTTAALSRETQTIPIIFTLVADPVGSRFVASLPVFETAAKSFNIAPIAAPVHSDAEIETFITSLGREPAGALFGGPDSFITNHRATIISLAARNHLPTVFENPVYARDGGLVSYGADFRDNFGRSARYVDNILRGTKPSELPVQMPLKYLLIINLKTAKALGITVPQTLLVAADEVIQ